MSVPDELRRYVPRTDLYDSYELIHYHMPVEQPPATASYIIFKKGNKTYAKNGTYGHIEYESTDAATTIQSAIDSLTSGGKILIKAGEYEITSTIKVGEAIAIEGENRGYRNSQPATRLRLSDGANCVLLKAKGENAGYSLFITLKNIWFYGNSANQTSDVNLVDLYDGGSAIGSFAYIENCYFSNAKATGLEAYLSTVIGCYFMNAGKYLAAFHDEDYVSGCQFSGGGWSNVALGNGVRFIGNNVTSANEHGILIYGYQQCIIANNRVFENRYGGIRIHDAKNNIIVGNWVYENSQYGANAYSGILIDGSSTDNIINGNRSYGTNQKYGIEEAGTSDYNIITSNICRNNATGGISTVGTNTVKADNIE